MCTHIRSWNILRIFATNFSGLRLSCCLCYKKTLSTCYNPSDGAGKPDCALSHSHSSKSTFKQIRFWCAHSLTWRDQWIRTCTTAVLISMRGKGENLSQYCSKFMSSISNIKTHLFMLAKVNQPKNLTMDWHSSLRSVSFFIICIWGDTFHERKKQFKIIHLFVCKNYSIFRRKKYRI